MLKKSSKKRGASVSKKNQKKITKKVQKKEVVKSVKKMIAKKKAKSSSKKIASKKVAQKKVMKPASKKTIAKKTVLPPTKRLSSKPRLIVGNWKMNPANSREATKLFAALKRTNFNKIIDRIIVCPPDIYLADLASKYKGLKLKFGAQDVSVASNTESTGEISAEQLKNLKVEYVIIGHSERRLLGESNQIIAKKIRNSLEKGLKVILCVGETHRDVNGEYLRFIEKQLNECLEGFNKKFVNNLIVAYEPIWAIGTGGEAVDSHDLHQLNLFIKKILVSIFDRKIGLAVPVIYGGSVNEENARQLVESGEVEGLLIGRASLNPYVFINIIKLIA